MCAVWSQLSPRARAEPRHCHRKELRLEAWCCSDVWLVVSWVALLAQAAYLIHPLCTRAHHQAGQMLQLTSWASSESPPGRTEVNSVRGGSSKEVHKGERVGAPEFREHKCLWYLARREGTGSGLGWARPGGSPQNARVDSHVLLLPWQSRDTQNGRNCNKLGSTPPG